ncbi:MAG: SpoIIIAH-like family protein [Clostridia bacterium]|nr:SpoIIIAH-like family protein [Clostridia bacterium]
MKINKRQIVFLSLALVVCIAVYLNWRFLDNVELDNSMVSVDAGNSGGSSEEEGKTLGQAQLVETTAKDVAAYFTECRLSKQQTRDEALELLKSVAESEETATETKEKASNDMIDLAKTTDIEGTIESLIKAKGFSECMVYIGDDAVNVVVATSGLSAEQAAQINEIVISESGREASAIKIVEIKTEAES